MVACLFTPMTTQRNDTHDYNARTNLCSHFTPPSFLYKGGRKHETRPFDVGELTTTFKTWVNIPSTKNENSGNSDNNVSNAYTVPKSHSLSEYDPTITCI